MKVRVLAIHGIDTPKGSDWRTRWEQALGLSVIPLRWDSKSKVRDIARIALSPDYRRSQVATLLQQVIDHIDDPQTVIVAHSQGTVWMGRVLRAMAATSVWYNPIRRIPVIFLGSPLHNPLWSGMLDAIDLGGPYPTNPLSIYNDGDPVVCPRWARPRQQPYLDSLRIAVAGDGGHAEHMQYVTHPAVQQAICDALTYGRYWDKR